jgi:DNA-3-methyladenine glycosylase
VGPVALDLVARDPRAVAVDLLGLVLLHGGRAGRIVEVEAYCGPEDPASHAYRGPTPRNATMFGRAGLLYVYRSYGLHWCANVVCGEPGEGLAVLLRALEPTAGLEEMRIARSLRRGATSAPVPDRDLCRGPGRLCQALGIDGGHDGADLLTADRDVRLEDDGWRPRGVEQGPRIGISVAVEKPWRWWVAGSGAVSRGGTPSDGVPWRAPAANDVDGGPGSPAPRLTPEERGG